MLYNGRTFKWEEKTEGRRWRGGVPYTPQGQTWHVSTPTWLSRSLLWPNTLSNGSSTCMPLGCHGGVESSQFRILLHPLLDLEAE